MWAWLLFFVFGFIFMVFVAFWGFITMTRMKREHALAVGMLRALVQQADLAEHIKKLEQS